MSEPENNNSASAGDGKPVLTGGYDLRGNRISRVIRHWLRMKTRIMGNYGTGPGAICLAKLALLHWFGGPLFRIRLWLATRYQARATLRRFRNRLRGR